MECHSPLVTVVVITYNSSKYVIETLDSIYNQTYTNLELIISDDCSKDDTIKICEDWLKKNGNRFYHTEIITTEINRDQTKQHKDISGKLIKDGKVFASIGYGYNAQILKHEKNVEELK